MYTDMDLFAKVRRAVMVDATRQQAEFKPLIRWAIDIDPSAI